MLWLVRGLHSPLELIEVSTVFRCWAPDQIGAKGLRRFKVDDAWWPVRRFYSNLKASLT